MREFCKSNSISLVHAAPRTPTMQGLVEGGKRTFKENISNILREKKAELNGWCSVLCEAAYKKNIAINATSKEISYGAVFGIKPWKETNNSDVSTEINETNNETTSIVTRSSVQYRK